ncbi:MAG TPA: cation diffusion facilitator family transporter [Geminicoccaceae bacterium]|nr:cation diffusion facilitator family transporter [Geminicoccus sp.]HMU51029.1 cation diffusion facilitator family transporter [Geminicoccaceae bacterium]
MTPTITVTPERSAQLRRRAAAASLSLAVLLTLAKLTAALATGSLAVLSSLIDSVTDVVASGITFASVRIAVKGPDRGHRFGHGKVESLSALAQAAMIGGSGGYVLMDGIQRLTSPRPIAETPLGIAVMLAAMAATLALVLFQRRVVRQTGSQAIAADHLNYMGDLATNGAVVLSLALAGFGGLAWADPVIAIAIAAFLIWRAIGIGRQAIDTLMDRELPRAERELIKDIIRAHPEVHDLHDLRTREAGGTRFIEMHIELDAEMRLREVHNVTDALEAELQAAFPEVEIIIHPEPFGLEDARLDHRIAQRA